MAPFQVKEGTVSFEVSSVDSPCHTYYKIIGDIALTKTPRLVVVHGGPGAGHEYLLPFEFLWPQYGIPIVFYDQIGCASSTRLKSKAGDESFWQESLFLAELENLISTLILNEGPGFFLFGHSWGCRIAAAYAATNPTGLRRLILGSGMASSETWVDGMRLCCEQLPQEVQLVIKEEHQKGTLDSSRFREAMGVFQRMFFCRAKPYPPPELLPSFQYTQEDRTVIDATKGPSPLEFTGSFRDWTCISRLHRINVPTLLYNGEFDTSHDVTVVPLFENIPRVRWITIPGAGHMSHLEPEVAGKLFRTVARFLTQVEEG